MLTSIAQQENECEQLSENLDMEKLRACQFTNKLGSTKSLYDLFTAVDESSPISHSSEENAPKLLQAAFKMGLIPLALGEFWWGRHLMNKLDNTKMSTLPVKVSVLKS